MLKRTVFGVQPKIGGAVTDGCTVPVDRLARMVGQVLCYQLSADGVKRQQTTKHWGRSDGDDDDEDDNDDEDGVGIT